MLSDSWLETDEATDVLGSLSVCMLCLDRVHSEPAMWKWAVLSLHNAVQGAMVCHLSGTMQIGALTDQSARAWIKRHEEDRRGAAGSVPDDRLASPKDLFARLTDGNKRCEQAGEVLHFSEDQRCSFGSLHDFRNDFAHFTPKGWSIELVGLPRILLDVLSIVEAIAKDPWPFRHLKDRDRARLSTTSGRIRNTLETIDNT